MDLKQVYSDILIDHNNHPDNEGELDEPSIKLRGINPNCGDDYIIELKINNEIIEDGKFIGDGCAISKASIDMMLDLIIEKNVDEALRLVNIFMRMIHGEASKDEIEDLEDSSILESVSHMPARVKCAMLGWRTVEKMLGQDRNKIN